MREENIRKIGIAGFGLFTLKTLLALFYYLPDKILYRMPNFIYEGVGKLGKPLLVISLGLLSMFFIGIMKNKNLTTIGFVGILMCVFGFIHIIAGSLINKLLNIGFFDYDLYQILYMIPNIIFIIFALIIAILSIISTKQIKNQQLANFLIPLGIAQFIVVLLRTSYINLQIILDNYIDYSNFIVGNMLLIHHLSVGIISIIALLNLINNTNEQKKNILLRETGKMENNICKSCNTIIEGDSKFCSNCGQPITIETAPVVENTVVAEQVEIVEKAQPQVTVNVQAPSKFCCHCGNSIHMQAVVCPNCGCSTEDNNGRSNSTTGTEKSNIVAGLLALFLGGFGIHKFYLGNTGMGILYLLLTLFGGLLLFIPNFILGIVILVEAIMYFVADNQKFNEKYNKNYRR